MILPFIAVTNQKTSGVTDDAIREAIPALQHQVNYHFQLYWNAGCRLGFVPDEKHIPEKSWHLNILGGQSPVDRMGGLHTTWDGQPSLEVYAEEDAEHDRLWTVTASHEILETLADPWASCCWWVDDGKEAMFVSLEVCDPVGAEAYTYEIDGVSVCNFVLPKWFIPGSNRKYDYLGKCKEPLQVLPGGLITKLTTKGWQYLRHDGTKIDPKDLTPVSNQRRVSRGLKIPDQKKRIREYLYELVTHPEKMEEYWHSKEESLAKSGLTPAQQKILLEGDDDEVYKAMREESGPLAGEHTTPDLL